MTAARYVVAVVAASCWHTDGSAIIERECAHVHRTLSGAARCLAALIDSHCSSCGSRRRCRHGGDRVHSARWHGAGIRHADGSRLTEGEQYALYEVLS